VFLRVGVRPDYPSVIFPAVVLIGIAFGLGFSALSLAATDGVADREQGLAASLFQTSFQVGGAIVLAVVTAVIDARGASHITSAQVTLGAYRPALALITVVSAIGAITALSGLLPGRRAALAAAPGKSAPVRAEDLAAEMAREAGEAGDIREPGEAGGECGEPLNA
jgi:hypothetical protein